MDTPTPVSGGDAASRAGRSRALRGRRSECQALDELLDAAGAGASRVLVLRGQPGVGKSALLEYAVQRASSCRVARAAGVPSEMRLPFAGLHQLCAPMLDRLECLPAPQREALSTAFGLSDGEAPDRFLVSLAVLGLLGEVAGQQPLVCVVDDAQWLDRASAEALAFVARRLSAGSLAIVFAVLDSGEEDELSGLPELVVEGLGDRDAQALLGSVLRGPLDERVRDRIVAETRGNPSALLELAYGVTSAALAGGFGLPDAPARSGPIEERFVRQLEALPAATRHLLLVAAAEPLGDPGLLWRAAQRLGIADEAATPAEAAGLCDFAARVRFRHPLLRSAVYRAAAPQERQSVHHTLAEATDPEADPDRRAWHRAQAAPGPDADVAQELERSAGRARARGGPAAAAAFLERATALTLDPALRAARALAAAQATYEAGAPDAALQLLAAAEGGPLDELQRARVELLHGHMAFHSPRGSDAPPLLLEAARRLAPLDAELARETYLDALCAALFAGRLGRDAGVLEAAKAARAAGAAGSSPGAARAPDLLLDGLAVLITDGHAAGAPALARALGAFRGQDTSREEGLRWLGLAAHAAADMWDDETRHVLSSRHVELAREAGALPALRVALSTRILVHLFAGELDLAAALVEELEVATEAKGSHLPPYGALALAAFQGRDTEVSQLSEATVKEVMRRGEGMGLSLVHSASAVLLNGAGRYEEALAAARRTGECPQELLFPNWALVELIEAAVRSGQAEAAADAVGRLSETTRASGTDWALGVEARSRALLSEGAAADDLYREAIERLGRTRVRIELGRAHLLYGEWLRRENRRLDAREHLRRAHEMFRAMGAEAFAERARHELLTTGETARKRSIETRNALTPQEAQIAWLARDGLSNPEIGSRLFISPRTVEYHLRKVFAKLSISSRNQLRDVLPDPGTGAAQAA
ncbi:MAG TPA: AAA family ATPase [Baekduia sp.]|uniref:helix-turn-helix transcriptional regulator n=1 Tax=Baekduia sp. TaxID=2600305 RepID=UPI002C853E31|nr:AAA family ATPase [Baekduia sp.]HMJ36598.1 AAA family ATPase [Baekduia sp.]